MYLAVALPILAAVLANLSSVDLTYHLRAGNEILQTGAIPSVDTWTYTSNGLPWVDQQWGAQVILAGTERLGGWTGLVLLRAAVTGSLFGAVALIARRRGLNARWSAFLALAAFVVAAPALALRPQLLGMACFVLVLLLVTDRRDHPGRLWIIPLVIALWANLHGSFFLGPVVLVLAWLEDRHHGIARPDSALLVALVCVVAAFATPSGPFVWAYAIGLSINPEVTTRITEWQPTSLRDVPGILFFASAMGVGLILARLARPTPWPTLAWLGFFFLIGAYAIRGVAWWPIAAAVAIAGLIGPVAPSRPPRSEAPLMRRLNGALAVGIALACVVLLPVWRPLDPGLQAPVGVVGNAPSGITATLRELARPGDRLFAPQPWGSWFEYAIPDVPVALDSRIELFPTQVWADYARVVDGREGWEQILKDWDVTLVVAAGDGGDDFALRLAGDGWINVYQDPDGWILVRRDGS